MRVTHHLDSFIKAAAAAVAKPYSMGDSQKASEGYNRKRQEYAQNRIPAEQTRPDLVDSQRTIQPPPV